MLFLSGATIPDMFFSGVVKRIAAFLPMTYAVDLMQGVFAGDGLSGHGRELLVLGGVAAGCTVVGTNRAAFSHTLAKHIWKIIEKGFDKGNNI